jgi:hypothetical protein
MATASLAKYLSQQLIAAKREMPGYLVQDRSKSTDPDRVVTGNCDVMLAFF